MKLWFDEDLSHTLVQVAGEFGLVEMHTDGAITIEWLPDAADHHP